MLLFFPFSSSDSDYAGSSALSGSLMDFIDFAPEFNQNNVMKLKENNPPGDMRSMRPRKWLVDYAQQHCGAQLSSSNFHFSARKRDRRDMEED